MRLSRRPRSPSQEGGNVCRRAQHWPHASGLFPFLQRQQLHQHLQKRGLGCPVAACDAQKCRNRLDSHRRSQGGRYLQTNPCYLPRCVLLVEHLSCPGRGHGTQYCTVHHGGGCAGGPGRSLKGGLHVGPRESDRYKIEGDYP